MTEKELRNKVVNQISEYYSKNAHQEIINTYNSHKPLARGYKMTMNDAWCAATVSAVAIATGLTSIIPTECSCEKMIELHKALGSWVENDAYTPTAGDIIFYDWDDSGIGDCTGFADHVGIVINVSSDNTITVIEGNKSDAVGMRAIPVNSRFIRGYAVPKYSKLVTSPNTPSDWAKTSWSKATYKKVFDGTNPKSNITREQVAVILDRLGLL